MNGIDDSTDFQDQVAGLDDLDGSQKLLLIELLQYEQEMEAQGTEFRYKEGINNIIDSYIARQSS